MKNYASLPLQFLKFWYMDSPREILGYFASLNHAFFELFSLPLLLKTFFKPLKNEYRDGLVRFSRIMGMIVKSVLIFIDIVFLMIILTCEFVVFVSFVSFPLLTVLMLFL